MLKVGDKVWHINQPEFHGIGEIKTINGELIIVEWESLFGEIWVETSYIHELELIE